MKWVPNWFVRSPINAGSMDAVMTLLVSMILLFAPFETFYLLLALLLFGAAITATFLPRRL